MMRNRLGYAATTAVALTVTAGTLMGCSDSRPAKRSADAATSSTATSSTVAAVNGADARRTGIGRPNPYAYLPKVPSFKLTSKNLTNGKPLPTAQLSGVFGVPHGKDISPQLSWSGFPARTKSFVVSMYDPQAPTGSGFWHWVVADLPASTKSLPENAGAVNSKTLPAGAFQLAADAGAPRYIGGAPPVHTGVHDYYITVTALDIPKTGVKSSTSGAMLGFTIGSHTIARATLVAPTAAH